MNRESELRQEFFNELSQFVSSLDDHVSTDDGQWSIKGFIDVCRNIYAISSDTKIISKILEIHLFPRFSILHKKPDTELFWLNIRIITPTSLLFMLTMKI